MRLYEVVGDLPPTQTERPEALCTRTWSGLKFAEALNLVGEAMQGGTINGEQFTGIAVGWYEAPGEEEPDTDE